MRSIVVDAVAWNVLFFSNLIQYALLEVSLYDFFKRFYVKKKYNWTVRATMESNISSDSDIDDQYYV